MKRRMCLALILAATIVLTAAAAAAATYPLKKGSRGTEVKTMQEMLIDLGFLVDKADGIFGSRTEAAVTAWQQYRGADQTGRMSEEALTALADTWRHVTGASYAANLTEEELKDIYVEGCYPFEEDGETYFEYCYRHYQAFGLANLLREGGMPETMETKAAERLRQLWLKYIPELFEQWEDSLPEAQKHVAREQRAGFESALAEQREEWETGSLSPLVEEALWLDAIGADLCYDLYTAEGNTP